MKISHMYRTALVAITGLFLGATVATGAAAQTVVKNIVLVHGAWADGSNWSKVVPLLEAKGFHVVAVQNPLTSLGDDVAATKRAIALQDGPVILVGHSYGGVVITEAGNDPKVVGLVYVAAFAPGDGESIISISKPYPPTPLGGELRPDAQGFLSLTPKGVADDFAQDLTDAEKELVTATQGPLAGSTFGSNYHHRCVEDQAIVVRDCEQRSRNSSRAGKGGSGEDESHFDHAAVESCGHALSPERSG